MFNIQVSTNLKITRSNVLHLLNTDWSCAILFRLKVYLPYFMTNNKKVINLFASRYKTRNRSRLWRLSCTSRVAFPLKKYHLIYTGFSRRRVGGGEQATALPEIVAGPAEICLSNWPAWTLAGKYFRFLFKLKVFKIFKFCYIMGLGRRRGTLYMPFALPGPTWTLRLWGLPLIK